MKITEHRPGNQPLVSVIMPVFNGEKHIEEALESIFKQEYEPLQVIVVDDGSTDKTAGIINSFGNIEYIYQENQGQTSALNTGLSRARGELIAFLDADDRWETNCLVLLTGYLSLHPDVDCVFGLMKNFIDPNAQLPEKISNYKESIVNQTGRNLTTLITKKKVFEKTGYFNRSYLHNKHTEWICRVKKQGFRIETIPEVVLYRRLHDENMSYQLKNKKSELLKIAKSLIDNRRQARDPQKNR